VTAESKILASAMLLGLLATALTLLGCSSVNSEKIGVVTSTSLIAQIVEQVANADLFLLHGWQGEKFSQEIIASADNSDLIVVSLDIQTTESDNWMVPSVQREATDKITAALCQVDGQNSALYQQLAADYSNLVSAKEAELRDELDQVDLSAINVMCAEMQAGFVSWTGLNVVATYGRPDSLTPQIVRGLVDTGRASGVSLIIDNLQSGQDAGAGITEDLGATRIILSNFPGGFPDTETWEKAVDKNIQLILEATGQ